jgi:hypothetical protein
VAQGGELVTLGSGTDPGDDPVWQVELEPIEPPVLFLPPTASGIRLARSGSFGPGSGASVQRGPEGELRYQAASDRGVRYELWVSSKEQPSFTRLRPADRPRYLQLPPDLPPRIAALAARWMTDRGDDYRRALAVEQHLRRDYQYDLASPSGKYPQPLDHFLFESRSGHCEYFSTAMAVMLRTAGIPTRNVTGFVGGSYNRFGKFYAVRQGDAHSWVEVYIDGKGWLTFDPTPPSGAAPQGEIEGLLASLRDLFEAVAQRWNEHVVGYDLRKQVGLLESLSARHPRTFGVLARSRWRDLLCAAGLLLAAASAYWLYRRRRRSRAEEHHRPNMPPKHATVATRLYRGLDAAMAAIGVARAASMPPLKHARLLGEAGHPAADEIVALTVRYLDARYGDVPFDAEQRRDFEQRIRRIKDYRRVPWAAMAGPGSANLPAAVAPPGAARSRYAPSDHREGAGSAAP